MRLWVLAILLSGISHAAITRVTTTGVALDNGAALQTAMTNASCGDTIVLQAGATYRAPDSDDNPIDTGTQPCTGDNWITITSDKAHTITTSRVTVADIPKLAIVDTLRAYPVFLIANGSRRWKFEGLLITTAIEQFALGRSGNALVDYVSISPTGNTGPIWFHHCIFQPGEIDAGVYNISVQQGIDSSGGELWVTGNMFRGFGGKTNAAPKTISAATNSSSDPQVTSTHGQGANFEAQVTGATGNWTRLNGPATWFVYINSTTLSWKKLVGWIIDSGNTATVYLRWKGPHNLQTGDSVTLSGVTTDTDLNATYTITVVDAYSFTIPTTNVTDAHYCYTEMIGCANGNNSMVITVDSSSWGSISGSPELRKGSASNTYCVYSVSGVGVARVIDNYMDCAFSSVFMGGANAQYLNSATFSEATSQGGVMSNVRDLKVGDLMAVQTTGTIGAIYKTVKLETINYSTGEVTWSTFGVSGLSINETGTATTSGSVMTFVTGTNWCNENNAGNNGSKWNRGYTITINGSPYTISTCDSGSTITVSTSIGTNASPVAYSVDISPNVPGDARWNFRDVMAGTVVRGNTIDKPLALSHGGFCKAAHELKTAYRYFFDGNIYLGEPCVTYGHPNYDQNGASPGVRQRDNVFGNSVSFGGGRPINSHVDDPYHTAVSKQFHPTGSGNVRFTNNLWLNTDRYSRPFSFTNADPETLADHNTVINAEATNAPSLGAPGGCLTTTTPHRGFFNAKLWNNLVPMGTNGFGWQPGCTTDKTDTFRGSVIVDTNSYGSYGANFVNSQRATSWTAVSFVGTCDHNGTNWKNCKLSSGSTYEGDATDGGNPGADVELIEDRTTMASGKAGLVGYLSGQDLRAPWSIGSTTAAIHFTINAPISTCTVELFTAKSRATSSRHADASSAQACNRTGSVVNGNQVSYVFGGSSALTANTTYYYRILINSVPIIGEFTTLAAGAGISRRWNRAHECGTDGVTFGTSVAANTIYTVATGNVRYCRETSPVGAVKILAAP